MNSDTAVDLCREALMSAILIGSPILLVGMAVGLLIGLIQALTQVQDQTVSFVPKIFAMAVVMVACLPWVVQKMVDLTRTAFENAGMP